MTKNSELERENFSIENSLEVKECIICGQEFTNIDFPSTFHRMVTCGKIECAGKRRYDKWKERTNKI